MCSQVRRAEAVVASYLCYNSLELDPASLRCPVGIRGAKNRAAGYLCYPESFCVSGELLHVESWGFRYQNKGSIQIIKMEI